MRNNFEVHTWTLCEGWINCWTVTDENGIEQPDNYPTIKAAQLEIDELFDDIEQEIKSGERSPDEAYDRDDYRIFDTVKSEYVA